MNYHHLSFEFPALSDEAAASLYKFIEELMRAIDEQYYREIHRYYVYKSRDLLKDAQLTHENLDDPPF
jgi:hypothetical protein